ncbi:hypothetical protein EON64_09920 [archaeon]|nr:MAG: hypothetical protein EON64_09920 [archaeon]
MQEKYSRIEELRRENEELKARLSQLENRLSHLENQLSYGKLLISIQDLNSDDRLENVSSPAISKTLVRLRKSRVNVAHYIFDEDTAPLRDYKKKVLLQKLREEDNATLLVKKQGKELLTFLLSHLESKVGMADVSEVDVDDQEDVEKWWLD